MYEVCLKTNLTAFQAPNRETGGGGAKQRAKSRGDVVEVPGFQIRQSS